jgi:hypothetical protein
MSPSPRHSVDGFRCALVLFAILAVFVAPASVRAQQDPDPAVESEPTELPSVIAQFTTGIENREPVDQVTFVSNDVKTIYLYSDLRGFEGQTVTHRWLHGGETRAEISFEVRGPRWRVWSSKDLLEDWIGDWTVEIVRDDGEVVAAETFTYSAPDA